MRGGTGEKKKGVLGLDKEKKAPVLRRYETRYTCRVAREILGTTVGKFMRLEKKILEKSRG